MKRKLIKGLEMLVMAGFLVTAVGSNVHATENQVNENTENSSQQNENKSEEKNTDTGNDDTDKKGSDTDNSESVNKDQGKSGTDTDNSNKGSDKSKDADKDSTDDTEQIEEGKAAASEDGSDSENKDKDDSDKDADGETDESGKVPESEETVASTEDLEETTAEETLAETEALIEETVPAETKKEYLTMEDMEGLWSIDDITSYRFTKSGSGALVLPEHSYSFDYELEEDTLKVDFEKSNLRDSTFKVSIVDGVMNLQCLDEYFENEYELHKAED